MVSKERYPRPADNIVLLTQNVPIIMRNELQPDSKWHNKEAEVLAPLVFFSCFLSSLFFYSFTLERASLHPEAGPSLARRPETESGLLRDRYRRRASDFTVATEQKIAESAQLCGL